MKGHDSNEGRRFRIARGVSSRSVGDEEVILDLDASEIFVLDATGRRIWELLGEGNTTSEISDRLAQEYDGRRDQIGREVRQLVAALRDALLLEDQG